MQQTEKCYSMTKHALSMVDTLMAHVQRLEAENKVLKEMLEDKDGG